MNNLTIALVLYFYPRSPCGERPPITTHKRFNGLFLSTLSLRRATIISPHSAPDNGDFYPRSPCGERRNADCSCRNARPISIHALLAESDADPTEGQVPAEPFLSTLSLRRATFIWVDKTQRAPNFYPRSPCGERPIVNNIVFVPGEFLSTLSLRRATIKPIFGKINTRDFYPRSPCGERPIFGPINASGRKFLSTLSLRRATQY